MRILFGLFCFRADSLLSRNITIPFVPTVLPIIKSYLRDRDYLLTFFPDKDVTESCIYIYIL